jgi:hypothetical protein
MRKNPRRILSPQRLPFRHPGAGHYKFSEEKHLLQHRRLYRGPLMYTSVGSGVVELSRGASSRWTAARVWFGARWEYLTVMPMVLWPRSSCVVRMSTPAITSRVANV